MTACGPLRQAQLILGLLFICRERNSIMGDNLKPFRQIEDQINILKNEI